MEGISLGVVQRYNSMFSFEWWLLLTLTQGNVVLISVRVNIYKRIRICVLSCHPYRHPSCMTRRPRHQAPGDQSHVQELRKPLRCEVWGRSGHVGGKGLDLAHRPIWMVSGECCKQAFPPALLKDLTQMDPVFVVTKKSGTAAFTWVVVPKTTRGKSVRES